MKRLLDQAEQLAKDSTAALAHVHRERLVFDSAWLWTEGTLRQQKPDAWTKTMRASVIERYRKHWNGYAERNYAESVRAPVLEHVAKNLAIVESLSSEDLDPFAALPKLSAADLDDSGNPTAAAGKKAARLRLKPLDLLSTDRTRHEVRLRASGPRLHVSCDLPATSESSLTLTILSVDRRGRPAFPVRALFTGFPYAHPVNDGRLVERHRVFGKNTIWASVAAGDCTRMVPEGVHTFGHFISSKEFAKSHPEYFGMDASGKRVTDDLGTPSA